jgi:CheY-like chemotaxis protein
MSEQPLRILLVDDEELVRSAVRIWLEDEQFQIVEAASGAAALELLKNEPFDCCLLDLQLSDMSGVDVLKAARSGPRQPAWLVMTGNLDEETYQELKALAIDDAAILAKPIFDMDVLTGKILTAAGR